MGNGINIPWVMVYKNPRYFSKIFIMYWHNEYFNTV